MVKLILYSLLTGCNAFISTNEIVLMKAENVLKGVRERERKKMGKKKKKKGNYVRLFEIKVLYC